LSIKGLANSEQLATNFKIPISKNSFKNVSFKDLKKLLSPESLRVEQKVVQNFSPTSDADPFGLKNNNYNINQLGDIQNCLGNLQADQILHRYQ
jgi:hypothetical protein